ncbi:hypothetical protein AAT19DRAFT_13420 [Rhodotorula toruloides]|uniref:Uncharacterized protein n=1 Tax=Rhodotorula toruloides TaxID=5286 RepID=A0A2T0AEH1_RHOTO|nr:hypothetical protein AAT19DRAFT_13420 [Rhodotorula toruloides]
MLATPPIHAPLEQPVYPPPRASISNTPAPLHSASLGQPASRTPRANSHRHAKAAREALELVKRLADQVDVLTSGGEGSEGGQVHHREPRIARVGVPDDDERGPHLSRPSAGRTGRERRASARYRTSGAGSTERNGRRARRQPLEPFPKVLALRRLDWPAPVYRTCESRAAGR